jgi:hypothetical protein
MATGAADTTEQPRRGRFDTTQPGNIPNGEASHTLRTRLTSGGGPHRPRSAALSRPSAAVSQQRLARLYARQLALRLRSADTTRKGG